MNIQTFNDLEQAVRERIAAGAAKPTLAVVWPEDDNTLQAVALILQAGVATPILVGATKQASQHPALQPYQEQIQWVEADSKDQAAFTAINMARQGAATAIMKGLINTDDLLRAVLNKQTGILPRGAVLTHISACQPELLGRMLLFTDVAVIPYPTPQQRIQQIGYLVEMLHKMGVSQPRIALIHCSEHVNERHFPFTAHYVELRQNTPELIIDGPLDLRCALSAEALAAKHLSSPLEGKTHALVFPDIEAGNVFYKTITTLAPCPTAAVLQGAAVPVVVPSRGDSPEAKYLSCLLAIL